LKINKKSFLLRIFMVIFLVIVALVRGTLQKGGLHTAWCKVCNKDHREFVRNRVIVLKGEAKSHRRDAESAEILQYFTTETQREDWNYAFDRP